MWLGMVLRDSLSSELQEELQGQVADVPFEVLQQARSNGQALSSFSRAKKQVDIKRANKNRSVRPPQFSSLTGFSGFKILGVY